MCITVFCLYYVPTTTPYKRGHLLTVFANKQLNDLVGFVVALVALKVCSRRSLQYLPMLTPEANALLTDFSDDRLPKGPLVRVAESAALGRLLQRRVPAGLGDQYLLAVR